MDKLPYQSCVSVIKSRKMEQRQPKYGKMYITREERKHILSYVYFSKLYHVLKYLPELNKNFGQEDITYPLYSSSRSIYWRNKHLIEL